MKPILKYFKLIFILPLLIGYTLPISAHAQNVVYERVKKEKLAHNNSFLISLYRPSYVLPFSYSTKPYQDVYVGSTPQSQGINHGEVQFQFSFKVPVWQNFLNNKKNTLYAAYTQQSFWQAYSDSAFFRETNYEPEIFIAHHFNKRFASDWKLSFLNLGLSHQSNGRGGVMERSWNRVYGEAILSNSNWMFSLKPWIVIRDNSYKRYNQNLAQYYGYERMLVSYKFHEHVLSLEARNTVESRFSRGAVQASWSFPLTTHLRGYAQVFSGYGQSMIEYDHYTNSAGIGFALNDWI